MKIINGFIMTMLLFTTISDMNAQSRNPFFEEWKTPFKTPPFDEIRSEHYMPAFTEGIKQQKAEVDAIANNSAEPTFENTIEAMELSGRLLIKVNMVFTNLYDANSNKDMDQIARESSDMITRHRDDIFLNDKLFKRVKSVYDRRDNLKLSAEQLTVLDNYYLDFVEGGANLDPQNKKRFREINEELSRLSLTYGENVRKENSNFELVIDNEKDLAGLTEASIQSAKEKAEAKGLTGKWIFTIDKPSLIPALQYFDNRSIREKLYKAYMNRGNNNNEFDNKKIIARIVSLRTSKAHLLGYNSFSEFKLRRKMAKEPGKVYKFLNNILTPAMEKGKAEAAEMQELVYKESGSFKLEPWDWWYYQEKMNKSKFNLDEEMLRPYFKLENVLQGAFILAGKLFGITFTQRYDIQVYHPEVKVYEAKEADGTHIGIFYTDYFPRDGKRNGAWENNFVFQSNINNNFIHPILVNVGNFTRPVGSKPSLLSIDDALTLFHEFGHGLHFLLQNTVYPKSSDFISDFVELPSQIMENWALTPELLKLYAKHYETGEVIPDELIEKITSSRSGGSVFETIEYTSASLLDMDWHSITDTVERDVTQFEAESIKKMGLIPEILPRYLSTNFLHIASWGYESGYYSYQWAAVLDADAFEAFREEGLFDKATALSFRKNILEKGSSEDLMSIYIKFRGREPDTKPLLKRLGLVGE